MSAVTVKAGSNYALPECGFTAPERGAFQAWEINSTAYRAGDSYQVNESIEVKVVRHVVEPTTYQVTVTDDGNGTGTATSGTAAAGTEIVLSATAKGGITSRSGRWSSVTTSVSAATASSPCRREMCP